MEYVLKHKNKTVLSFELDDTNDVVKIYKIVDTDHLPFMYVDDDIKLIKLMSKWIQYRGIPKSRDNYNTITKIFNVHDMKDMMVRNLGLNLTDQYWICPKNKTIDWFEVNHFDNEFTSTIGKAVFENIAIDNVDALSPDLSLDGSLNKRWIISNNERLMLKTGSGDLKQEPFNEYIASLLMDFYKIRHVDYKLNKKGDAYFSVCKCMVDRNTEFINAFMVLLHNTEKQVNKYHDFIKICERKGIKNTKKYIDEMICVDYMIGNMDRHLGNFGIIRNADTLEWIEIAPIFDNGTSLWCKTYNTENISWEGKEDCRSFDGVNELNLKYVAMDTQFIPKPDSIYFNAMRDIYALNKNMKHERIEAVVNAFEKRIVHLAEKIALHQENRAKPAKRARP
jgi:hypothetical protein